VCLQCKICVIHTWALQWWASDCGALYKCLYFYLYSRVTHGESRHVLQLLASCLPTDKRVLAKMKELTRTMGVRRTREMKKLIRDFVCNVLFAGQEAPPRFDSRFWPSDKTVMNTMYSTRMKARYVVFQSVWLLSFYLGWRQLQDWRLYSGVCGSVCVSVRLSVVCRCLPVNLAFYADDSRRSKGFSGICLFVCLSVCLHGISKTNDPTLLNLLQGTNLRYPASSMILG